MIHLLLAALAAIPSCWGIYDTALTHSAASAHPPYITYDERISITHDGESLLYSSAHIDYRDDGIARVADERWDYSPFVTADLEPGPPELGPYGHGRSMRLPPPPGERTIAAVRAKGMVTCTVDGIERLKAHDAYHLVFQGANPARGHLDGLWIDVHSYDIWRIDITGAVTLLAGVNSSIGLGNYQIELAYHGPYLVVDHVVWSYRQHLYSQYVDFVGEYTFSDFAFPPELPASFFVSVAQPLEKSQ